MAFSTWHLKTLSKSGGVKNSLTPPPPPLLPHLDGGRRFLGAGGHGNFSGILASLAVGVVERASSSSFSASPPPLPPPTRFVLMGLSERTPIPAITHFLDSDSKSECENPMSEKKREVKEPCVKGFSFVVEE